MDSLLELIRARRAELEAAAARGRDDEEAYRLEGSFIDFVEAGWPAIDPAEYQRCWAESPNIIPIEHYRRPTPAELEHLTARMDHVK